KRVAHLNMSPSLQVSFFGRPSNAVTLASMLVAFAVNSVFIVMFDAKMSVLTLLILLASTHVPPTIAISTPRLTKVLVLTFPFAISAGGFRGRLVELRVPRKLTQPR